MNWGLHWFRRDLRLPDNHALLRNCVDSEHRVLGLFCFDSEFLSRPDFSVNRFGFFLNTLTQLKAEFEAQGGGLLVIDSPPEKAFTQLLKFFKTRPEGLPSRISWGRDYEPFARRRDQTLQALIENAGIKVQTERDHLLFEPWEITKNGDPKDFYQIYTPYARRWFERLHSTEGQSRLRYGETAKEIKMNWSTFQRAKDFPFEQALEKFQRQNQKRVTVSLPEAGHQAAVKRLGLFKNDVKNYLDLRDIPSEDGTSKLSIYLKNGSLAVPQILDRLSLQRTSMAQKSGPSQFVKELAWREFYYMILHHRPDVERQSFLPQYTNLKWQNNEKWFELWKEGLTGFPIVDAGMRQLKQTGWMHNRVRMIVASFLVKDLIIDWRWGERHFMHLLLDGDLAPNNGGWQWAASTGCDPQPYFRIFNPWLQAQKFDPDANYIREFVPELKKLSAKEIHDPKAARPGYAKPMVDHAAQKDKILRLYTQARLKKN